MNSPPADLVGRLKEFGQEHVLAWWPKLADAERRQLVQQVQAIDLDELRQLYARREEKSLLPSLEKITPLPRPKDDDTNHDRWRKIGTDALASGQVAYLVVAGGQGSRLGFEHPKGMFPIGPATDRPLFQIFAERILALSRRHDVSIPFLVMTSPATDLETRDFFKSRGNFGLPEKDVRFFQQGTMPALDLATGNLLMEAPHQLFLGPNGHGGTLTGLADSGLLDELEKKGIRTIYYFQVDNPLVQLADMAFLGQHLEAKGEVSSKVITKLTPTDKLGNYVLVDGHCHIIEYSDLPRELAEKKDSQGRLLLWAGNPAIHLFDVAFLRKVTQGSGRLPWHVAKKKVPYLNESGQTVQPATENALKFERFIFDVLPMAERWTVVPTTRPDEFEPVKNATGLESPASAKQAISNQGGNWLERAGVNVPRDEKSNVSVPIEISPLYALDAEELTKKVDRKMKVVGPLVLA